MGQWTKVEMSDGRQDLDTRPERGAFAIRRLAVSFAALSLSLAASRGLSIGSLLLFSWFSGPEPFAPFGLYIALVSVFWVAVFGCYEQAILVAHAQDTAALSWLASAVATGFVSVLFVACCAAVAFGLWLPDGLSDAPVAVLCIPLSLALRGANRLALIFATRAGEFAHVAKTNWVQAAVQGAAQLLLLAAGRDYLICLVLADLLGLWAGTVVIALRSNGVREALAASRPSARQMWDAAGTWRMMPLWRLPMSLVSVAAISLPALTIPLAYPAALAGQFLFALRMLEMPSFVVTGAVSPLLQRQLTEREQSPGFAKVAVLLLTLVAVAGFALGGVAATIIDDYFTNTRWFDALAAVPWLVPYFIGLTISAPLVGAAIGPSIERRAMLLQGLFFVLSLGAAALLFVPVDWSFPLLAFGGAMLMRAFVFARLYLDARRISAAGR